MSQEKLEIAAFGMGCFWGPDALFGAQEGVIRTQVGYAGGTKENPTYSDIGDHTETLLVEFDSENISYPDLLKLSWDNHYYSYNKQSTKNQYASRIFYTSQEQREQAEKSKAEKKSEGKVATEIQKLNFTVAENYHQKYRLRHSRMMENFSEMAPEKFRDSPLAAKLNGFVAGHLDLEDIDKFNLEVEPGIKDCVINTARKFL
jgi:methionine-S-sulfoxide reductase